MRRKLPVLPRKAGAAAVAVHGRTREQYYAGSADWDIIRRVKEALTIPVIGNGDVTGPESAERMLRETGCDAVLIGRAARGNPWIFRQTIHYLETGGAAPQAFHGGGADDDAAPCRPAEGI